MLQHLIVNKKIITTTDPILNLPSPSQSFVKKYCEKGGINKAMVEYDLYCDTCGNSNEGHNYRHPIISSTLKPKVDKNNCITIRPIKTSWTKDEVIELCKKIYMEDGGLFFYKFSDLEHWIKENL